MPKVLWRPVSGRLARWWDDDARVPGLSEFVYVSMSPEQVAGIGHLPEGHALQSPRVAGRGLRDEIVALATEAAAILGFEPRVCADERVSDATSVQLLAVLREALSNVVRHAGASRTSVAVEVTDTDVLVTVVDDGVGAGAGELLGGQGLARAQRRRT